MWHTVLISGTEWENFFALRCPQYTFENRVGLDTDTHVYRSWKDACKDTMLNKDAPILARLKWNKGQADIHMMALAEAMWDCMNESTPNELEEGEWHLPMIEVEED